MRAVAALAAVELRRFLADRFNLFFVFVLPLILVVVLGLQSTDPGPGRVAVAGGQGVDQQVTAELVERLGATGVTVDALSDADGVDRAVGDGAADLGVVITAADPVSVDQVAVDGRGRPELVELVRTVVTDLALDRHRVEALVAAGADRALVPAALEGGPDGWRSPEVAAAGEVDEVLQELSGLGRFDLGASGQLLVFVFLNTLTAAGAMIQARRNGVVRRTLAAPVTGAQTLTGLALGRFVIAIFQGCYIMLASALLFGVAWGDPVAMVLVLGVFAAVAAGTALLIGVVMDAEGPASGVAVGSGLVLAALGGCMVPLDFFPDGLRRVAHLTPHAWAYEAIAEVQRRGGGPLDILPQLGVLTVMAAGVLAVGAWALRRSLARPL